MVSKAEFEELRAKLITYEQQQNESQEKIKNEARIQVDSVAVGLRELYVQASSAVTKLDTKVEKLGAKRNRRRTEVIVAAEEHDNQYIGEN